MLEYLGEDEAAASIARAVRDFEGDASILGTAGITTQLLERL
jgi:hypothetical protein